MAQETKVRFKASKVLSSEAGSRLENGEFAMGVDLSRLFYKDYQGHLHQLVDKSYVDDKTKPIPIEYGVRVSINPVTRSLTQSSPTLTRVTRQGTVIKYGLDTGLVYNPSVDGGQERNDFAWLFPWNSMRRVNLSPIGEELAVEGGPGYKTDGSNGDVMTRKPLYFKKIEVVGEYLYWWMCEELLSGYWPVESHVKPSGEVVEVVYRNSYGASTYVDASDGNKTKLRSQKGVKPADSISRTNFRSYVRNKGVGWQLLDLQYWTGYDTFLNRIKMATLDAQSKVRGLSDLMYSDGVTIADATEENTAVLAIAVANSFTVGQYISIGTSAGSRSIATFRKIISIEDLDGASGKIVFDGAEVAAVSVGNYVWPEWWLTGETDSVYTREGSLISNLDGKHPCVIDNVENPYGDGWKWIDGVNIRNWTPYICKDPDQYQDNKIDSPYFMVDCALPHSSGYVRDMCWDADYPFVELPVSSNGSAGSYYSDNWNTPSDDGDVALLGGGNRHHGSNVGPCSFLGVYSASHTFVNIGAGFTFRP